MANDPKLKIRAPKFASKSNATKKGINKAIQRVKNVTVYVAPGKGKSIYLFDFKNLPKRAYLREYDLQKEQYVFKRTAVENIQKENYSLLRPNPERERPGKFELYKDKQGEYRFRLKAGNGQIILVSEGYKEKSSAAQAIESVKRNAVNVSRFEKRTSSNGKHYFVLKAANHQVIGSSEIYESDSGRDNGIQSVHKNAPGADLVEQV